MYHRVIHLGDAGRGAIACGAKEKRGIVSKNWTWKPENVTCKHCLKIYRRRNASNWIANY